MVGSGECSRQSPLWVGEDVSEAKEEEVALLLRIQGNNTVDYMHSCWQ